MKENISLEDLKKLMEIHNENFKKHFDEEFEKSDDFFISISHLDEKEKLKRTAMFAATIAYKSSIVSAFLLAYDLPSENTFPLLTVIDGGLTKKD